MDHIFYTQQAQGPKHRPTPTPDLPNVVQLVHNSSREKATRMRRARRGGGPGGGGYAWYSYDGSGGGGHGGAASGGTYGSAFEPLTLGSGAAAMVLGPADRHPEGHRVVAGITRAGTEHHDLCVGDMNGMRTDTQGLLDAGLQLAEDAWKEALVDHEWQAADRYILHQVSSVHTNALCERLGLDQTKVPLTFPTFGNIGPAALPFTLAQEVDKLATGDQVLCLGIGSGLNTAFLELAW